ncbi:hypothetical protein AB1484_36205 [Parafrankia sp. FMc6]|uniref:hypothetical protein n=1 Tax=Parafrankia soli TaxID=2599596 RepID=UPI0034D478C5
MLLERTSARPVGSMPAGGGPKVNRPMFDEDVFYGPTRGYLAARVPLTYALMVAALVDGETLTREDLRTPAEVRYEVEFHVAFRGMSSVFESADRVADANLNGDAWLMFCHQAVAGMLAAEGVPSGVDELNADELTGALMVFGALHAENLATPADVRAELTRIAYLHGVDDLRWNAANLAVHPYQVNAPVWDTEEHAWPEFCRQAVAAMLAADTATVAA